MVLIGRLLVPVADVDSRATRAAPADNLPDLAVGNPISVRGGLLVCQHMENSAFTRLEARSHVFGTT